MQAIAAYTAASETFLESAQRLNEAWRHYFEASGPEPSPEWVADVAAQQLASDLALGRARTETVINAATPGPGAEPGAKSDTAVLPKTRRKRRRENKFLGKIGTPGQRMLRGTLLILLVASTMLATAAGISLALEFAGFIGLVDNPVRLPVGIQLALFIAATGMAIGMKKLLKPVERALYGSKGVRPKVFQL